MKTKKTNKTIQRDQKPTNAAYNEGFNQCLSLAKKFINKKKSEGAWTIDAEELFYHLKLAKPL